MEIRELTIFSFEEPMDSTFKKYRSQDLAPVRFTNPNFNHRVYLNMSINQVIQFKIIIVLTEGIDQSLGNLQPSNIKDKLYRQEKWVKEVEILISIFIVALLIFVVGIFFGGEISREIIGGHPGVGSWVCLENG